MKFPFREPVPACIHPETYRYFLGPSEVDHVWEDLAQTFGAPRKNEAFRTVEIDGKHLLLRAVFGGNPITVIQKRGCPREELVKLYEILGWSATPEGR